MNTGDYGQQRPRPLPNGNPAVLSSRPNDHRNGVTAPSREASGGPASNGPFSDRAERFEDEKKRIIESCFGKKEPDGSCKLCVPDEAFIDC